MNHDNNNQGTNPNGQNEGNTLVRKPSKRQQEKAPEGQSPRMNHDDDEAANASAGAPGPAPAESRFTENIDD